MYLVIVGRNSKVLLIVLSCQKIRLFKGYFMNLMVAWRDSLTLFQPKNLKLFLLVTLKAMGDAGKVWLKYFWWVPVIVAISIGIMLYLMNIPNAARETSSAFTVWMELLALKSKIPKEVLWFIPSLQQVIILTMVLSTRPSTAIKNCAYFRFYFWRLWLMGLCFEWSYFLLAKLNIAFQGQIISWGFLIIGITLVAIGFLSTIYLLNYALFVFDGDGSVANFFRSLLYAAKMTLFNLPFYSTCIAFVVAMYVGMMQLLLYLAQHYPEMQGFYTVGWLQVLLPALMLLQLVMQLFAICFITNFYVKKLHDQFTLYYGKNA